MAYSIADAEPTFDLPAGSSSDFYLSREINDREDDNNGKTVKKHGLWRYPFLTRRTGDSLVGTNEQINSSEFRHGRTAAKVKLGNASSSGNLDLELSPETFDDQLEGVFRDKFVRFFHDGQKDLITKDYMTPKGYIHVNGDDGTYNQWYDSTKEGKRVTQVPLFYTGNEAGTEEDPFGLIKVSPEKLNDRSKNPLGKFIAHELHIGNTPVKYSALSRIPITEKAIRLQNFRHVEMGELNLNVAVNAIVTGSFSMNGSNNPDYYTESAEKGKTRMADQMYDKKVMATGATEDFYSTDYRDAAERFVAAARNTTKSTDTDQFTALDGFLYVNGHQLQFASALTMDLNNNLQAINAIFVKNAIANLSPSLAVTGNITAYFTDGEKDGTGKKYGADDLKNLASQNKDTEILYAFIDKEDPEVIYLFQVFKATISAPTETKDAESPISLDLPYTSYGEMAVRLLRLAIPKISFIDMDMGSMIDGGDMTKLDVTLIPNVPLDKEAPAVAEGIFSDKDYIDSANTNGLYVFNDAEFTVYDADGNKLENEVTVDTSTLAIGADGEITATLNFGTALEVGQTVKVKLTVNGANREAGKEVAPDIPYLRMGDAYKESLYKAGYVAVQAGDTINVLTAKGAGDTAEDDLIYKSYAAMSADDIKVESSDDAVASVSGAVVTIGSSVAEGANATITVTSKYDKGVFLAFDVQVGGEPAPGPGPDPTPDPVDAQAPTFSETLENVSYETTDTATPLNGAATVSDGGTVTYQWYKDDVAIEGATSAEYTPDITTEGEFVYKIVATNTNASATGATTATANQSCTVTVVGA